MAHRFGDRIVKSVAVLLEVMKEHREAILEELPEPLRKRFPSVWYRGLPCQNLELLPTLHRNKIPVADEVHLMNRFKQNAHEFLAERPQGEWEWMLLARHHGLPSRLLDWTENPLVGLFFAANGYNSDHAGSDGALWCLSPSDLNSFASNRTIKDPVLPMFLDENERSDSDLFLANYQMSRVRRSVEGPALPPAAAISIRTNKRIQAQLGVFTIHHADTRPLEQWNEGTHLWRYIVPADAKALFLEELRSSGITALSLFPELDNVASEASRGY